MRTETLRTLSPILVATLVGLLGLVAAEAVSRLPGVDPNFRPGWTRSEYQERLFALTPADVAFVGDSRTGWGIAETTVTEVLAKPGAGGGRAVNLGLPATSVQVMLDDVAARPRRERPGVIVVDYSPGTLFHFEISRFRLDRTRQDRIDSWMIDHAGAHLAFLRAPFRSALDGEMKRLFGRRPPSPAPVWASRTVHPEGFVEARLGMSDGAPIDAAAFQIDYYRHVVDRIAAAPDAAEARLAAVETRLAGLRAQGVCVGLMRLPVGAPMLEVERTLPERFRFRALADRLAVPAFDFMASGESFATWDNSHVRPEVAVAIAPRIADFVARVRASCAPR